jgi:hypothetical protein
MRWAGYVARMGEQRSEPGTCRIRSTNANHSAAEFDVVSLLVWTILIYADMKITRRRVMGF